MKENIKNKSSNLLISNYLSNFIFAEFLFNLEPEDSFKLGHFKGATLRGGFGYAFKKLVCFFGKEKICNNCSISSKCPYRIIFESQSNDKKFFNIKEIPRPFVIEPPYTEKQIYRNTEIFPVKLILIGKSIEYFPYFFLSFSSLGEIGLGANRKKYSIKSVFQIYPQNILIYTENSDELKKPVISPFTEKISQKASQITLNFISPTRIKFNGKLISVPEFHHIIRALIHRITLLSFYWCDVKIEYEWKNLIEEAKDIKIKTCELRWVDWERFSSKQKTKMKFGGFRGKITYTGNLEKFLPLLLLGSHLHIGKSTTFGLGKYCIEKNE